ncbi:hypothetical protein RvY_18236-2 [Ramazzottius varieornatus]|nr:hypothetical protein RvY_18236-2 [Ramazzottius varieornatus]
MGEVRSVEWPGPLWPVPNRPVCGYDGQDRVCWASSVQYIETAVASAATLLVIFPLMALVLLRLIREHSDKLPWWLISGNSPQMCSGKRILSCFGSARVLRSRHAIAE